MTPASSEHRASVTPTAKRQPSRQARRRRRSGLPLVTLLRNALPGSGQAREGGANGHECALECGGHSNNVGRCLPDEQVFQGQWPEGGCPVKGRACLRTPEGSHGAGRPDHRLGPCQSRDHDGQYGLQHGSIEVASQPRCARLTPIKTEDTPNDLKAPRKRAHNGAQRNEHGALGGLSEVSICPAKKPQAPRKLCSASAHGSCFCRPTAPI